MVQGVKVWPLFVSAQLVSSRKILTAPLASAVLFWYRSHTVSATTGMREATAGLSASIYLRHHPLRTSAEQRQASAGRGEAPLTLVFIFYKYISVLMFFRASQSMMFFALILLITYVYVLTNKTIRTTVVSMNYAIYILRAWGWIDEFTVYRLYDTQWGKCHGWYYIILRTTTINVCCPFILVFIFIFLLPFHYIRILTMFRYAALLQSYIPSSHICRNKTMTQQYVVEIPRCNSASKSRKCICLIYTFLIYTQQYVCGRRRRSRFGAEGSSIPLVFIWCTYKHESSKFRLMLLIGGWQYTSYSLVLICQHCCCTHSRLSYVFKVIFAIKSGK